MKVIYDTSVFIAYRPHYFPAGFVLSAIVVQEMTAGASDTHEVRFWEAVRSAREQEGKLLVPTGEDWWFAGKVLNSLLRGLKSHNRGRTPKLPPDEKQRLIRDVLIARTAKRAGALVVTDNVADFEMIRRFCSVQTVQGEDFFA